LKPATNPADSNVTNKEFLPFIRVNILYNC
jgi:hypothetical protein